MDNYYMRTARLRMQQLRYYIVTWNQNSKYSDSHVFKMGLAIASGKDIWVLADTKATVPEGLKEIAMETKYFDSANPQDAAEQFIREVEEYYNSGNKPG